MSLFDSSPVTPLVLPADQLTLDGAQLAAAAFLARYSGRTLDSYRTDLRQFFQWAHSVGLAPLNATRPHIELYRAWMDERGLAASTVDRRLSTICGYTASPTSTAAFRRTLPNTCDGHESTRRPSAAWTAVSWPRSFMQRSEPHRCTPRSPSCSASTGSG